MLYTTILAFFILKCLTRFPTIIVAGGGAAL
jgi:hypothetical protein